MYFEDLQNGLITALRARLRSGDLTERRLARSTGILQPHIHNVLKGARILSPQNEDRILERFRIPLAELLRSEDVRPQGCVGCGGRRGFQEVPVLEDWVGPGLPLSFSASRFERYPFPIVFLEPLGDPAVARAAADPKMSGALCENDFILLDRRSEARTRIREEALYLVNRAGRGRVSYSGFGYCGYGQRARPVFS